jgi:hypothetical protein
MSTATVRWTALFLLCVAYAGPTAAASGWQEEERLTYDEAVSYGPPNNGKYIAVDLDGRVHVVWADERDRNLEIYHKVKTGGVWSLDERLTSSAERSARPVLAVDITGRLHLVWNDSRDGNKEIYHRIWNGSWSPETRVTNTEGDSFASSIVADGYTIHLVYNEVVGGHTEIIYRYFDFLAWSEPTPLTGMASGDRMVPSIAIGPDGALHVAWWDTREDPPGNTEGKIYYRRKTTDWLPEECISGPAADAMRPNVAVDDSGRVHVVWIDKRDQYEQIYYRRWSSEAGWGPETPLTSGNYTHYHPSIASAGGEVFLVYWATYPTSANPGVFFRSLALDTWSPATRISDENSSASICCLIAEPDKNLHAAWVDQRDGNMEIYYRHYIHPQNGVGNPDGPQPPPTPPPPLALGAAPNPFRTGTRVDLSLPEASDACIRIYDVAGRRVRVLIEGRLPSGPHAFPWDGTDERGRRLPPGLYLVRASAGKRTATRKVLLAP